jgi:hypothetical protein
VLCLVSCPVFVCGPPEFLTAELVGVTLVGRNKITKYISVKILDTCTRNDVCAYDNNEDFQFDICFANLKFINLKLIVAYTFYLVFLVSCIWTFSIWVVPVFLFEYCIIILRICCLLFKCVF